MTYVCESPVDPEEIASPRVIEDLANRIAAYVKERRCVSWPELVDRFPEMNGGEWMLEHRGPDFSNVAIWAGFTRLGLDAYHYARKAGLIKLEPIADFAEVLLMGGGLTFPLAKKVCHYKKPRWAPSWIVPGDRTRF